MIGAQKLRIFPGKIGLFAPVHFRLDKFHQPPRDRVSDIFCMRFTLTLGIAMLLITGCADQNTSAIRGLSQRDADALNAQHSKFDSVSDPEFTPQTRFAAGQLAESQNAPAAAIEQYKAAIKLDPKHAPSLYRLGVLYAQFKRYPEAIDTWKQYIKATNGSATAYGNLAFCHELAGQTREAEAAYQQGVQKDPKNQPCRINYGLMLVRLGRVDEGKQQLGVVLPPAKVHYNVGSVYEHMGRGDDAKSEYEKALELDPKLWEAQSRLTRID